MANATSPTTPLLLLSPPMGGGESPFNNNKEMTTTEKRKKKKKTLRDRVFEKCSALLRRLLRHKYAWVFDAPVDVRGLGLHDYYAVIRSPMDLGTVRTRLEKGRYRSPRAFAEDVRLTFRNAMAYNYRGDDAYAMAEELSDVFERRWVEIEDEFGDDALDSLGSAAAAAAAAADSQSLDLIVLEERRNVEGEHNDEEVHEVIYIGDEEEENNTDHMQNLPTSSAVGGVYHFGSSSDPGSSSRDPGCEIHLEHGSRATNNVELICK